MKFSIHQASHIGDRKYNQDRVAFAYSNDTLLLVLADGMGGHFHGEVAAGMAMDTFVESFGRHTHLDDPLDFLSDTMRTAHQRIMALPLPNDQSFPGTTCVAALIQDGKLYWGHAGDSRLYLLRKGAVFAKTLDHSMVQMWLACGVIDEDEARTHPRRNQITNCLGGVEDMFEIELGTTVELQSGDVVLLCSDGLCGPFVDKELVAAFAGKPVDVALDKLIAGALLLEKGKSDNATGLAMRWSNTEAEHDTDVIISHILEIP
ncbi:MAG: protein phosphatase 2C domain-containing protein [Proteobacteria bacterium]|nr:protein phosphatase 2C domain-containing protein [Pseudomonadota bacterium]